MPGLQAAGVTVLPTGVRAADLALSPDGAVVAVAATNGQAALFDAGLTAHGWIGTHAYPMHQIAWSPDGHTLATASTAEDDPVRLWDTRERSLIADVRGQNFRVEDLAFAPDGNTLAVAAGDKTVALYRTDPGDAVDLLCARLTPAVRAQGGTPPRLCR
ncbi:hypothetical protein AB0M20_07690 [Actinoplanes sp. NPDC051633]|uniref:WD40 repeat domain-containing protein n=1 Tax=Actinoplanes sp. NPDC051633 TaxID=3155670 RepID=UPI00342EE5DC